MTSNVDANNANNANNGNNGNSSSCEQVVMALLAPHKNGFVVNLQAGKQRTGFVRSFFHKHQIGVWRVLHKEGEPQPHIQIQVGDQVHRIDDLTYMAFIDSVRAMFEAQQKPEPISDTDRAAVLAALTPVPLQNFMASISQPNEADQTWTFDGDNDKVNVIKGTVYFLRGDLTLPFSVELVEYKVKGKRRHKLMLSVDKQDPVRIRNVDDAIEAAYAVFDLHRPGQQRHLMVYDQVGAARLEFYAFHVGTRISRLAKAVDGLYVNTVIEPEDGDVEAKTKALDDFQAVFVDNKGKCRYSANAIESIYDAPLVHQFDLVTFTGFLP
jgi:hypothetical protein